MNDLAQNILKYIQEVKNNLNNNITYSNYQPLPYIEAKAQIEAYSNIENYINYITQLSQGNKE